MKKAGLKGVSDFAVVDYSIARRKQMSEKEKRFPRSFRSLARSSLSRSRFCSPDEERAPLFRRRKATHVQVRWVAFQPEPAPLVLDADVEVSASDSLGARNEDGDVVERLGPLVGDAAVGEDVLVSASRGEGFLS